MQSRNECLNNDQGISVSMEGTTITSSRDTIIQVTQTQAPIKYAMEVLKQHVSFGALYNSKERFDPPKCHPDTRKAVLANIDRWAHAQEASAKPILWLRGPMGAGKSAIAQTSAERWAQLNALAASFFFSRSIPGRNNNNDLIPTLAYQLTLSVPSTRPHIERAILDDIGLFEKTLLAQLEALIIQPLATVISKERGPGGPVIIIIDGLDECSEYMQGSDGEAQQRAVLEAIVSCVNRVDCPFRFLVASRPERQIRSSFSQAPLSDLLHIVVLDDTQDPNADIQLFLNCGFDDIRRNHPYLGPSWPAEGTIFRLLKKSSGHFIFAATALRYLERPRQDPRAALEAIMNIDTTTSTAPFTELDALYLFIMHSVLPDSLPIVLNIFGLMCFGNTFGDEFQLFSGCNYLSPVSLERYFFLPSGSTTHHHLVDLHSILEIPSENALEDVPIRFIHASFSDFLTDNSRSDLFWVSEDTALAQFQPIRLRHVIIQSLQPDFGYELGYQFSGFTSELVRGLKHGQLPSLSPAFAQGLATLIGEDKEEFASFVRDANLSHFRIKRNARDLETYLFQDEEDIEIILAYLKIHGLNDIKPFSRGGDTEECNVPTYATPRTVIRKGRRRDLKQRLHQLRRRLSAVIFWR